MTFALALIAVISSASAVALAVLQVFSRRESTRAERHALAARITLLEGEAEPAPPLLDRYVVVRTRDGRTIRGLIHAEYRTRLDLVKATTYEDGAAVALYGPTVHIPMSAIAYIEQLQAPEADA